MAATLEQKKAVARERIYRVQVAAGALDTWFRQTEKYQADPRLVLTVAAKDALVGDAAYAAALDEMNAAVADLPPKDWSKWEPTIPTDGLEPKP